MKMPRSQCESDNVQFVQELAEIDGPFEAPININFRDLTKLELPSLVWNRGDVPPKKMKITNTGHTVIISGKWKCERPYLTGGPLLGKYVFSQIHFHWGQTDCKGSEHQVCGEEFPLEMHVAHFKTEYTTQECALREKDGMVVVVYLFKLQSEPNNSLKKIINLLPCVKQPSTSQAIDPRPILSLCNPFSDDYFMYWGSVVTSTCAHILMWIICREPFGISREQVNEFRKIMDSCQQPICKNSREIQPLHKRNVFHVNASKHLEEPLLPVKKLLGCYCKKSEETVNVQHTMECTCHGTLQNQEDVEGRCIERQAIHQCCKGSQASQFQASLPNNYYTSQNFFVHTAMIQSVSIVLKRSGSDPLANHGCQDDLKKIKSEECNKHEKLISQSCCFLPEKEGKKVKTLTDKRKARDKNKKPFNSLRAFSQILNSLEALKNQTFKKLKEIESINQEIKEMKPFCQDTEDKKWLRKIEKIMSRQKRFTKRSSPGCLGELKRFAKECNFDKFFDAKVLPVGDNNQKIVYDSNKEVVKANSPVNYLKEGKTPETDNTSAKNLDFHKTVQSSEEAQKLVQSFFEDIKDSEETLKKELNFQKIKSFCNKQPDSTFLLSDNKDYITQQMFVLANLGNKFFTEVSTEDMKLDKNEMKDEKQIKKLAITHKVTETTNNLENESKKVIETEKLDPDKNTVLNLKTDNEISIASHKNNIDASQSNSSEKITNLDIIARQDLSNSEVKHSLDSDNLSETERTSNDRKDRKTSKRKKPTKSSTKINNVKNTELYEKLIKALKTKMESSNSPLSSSNLSTESTRGQRMIIAKLQPSRKDFWKQSQKKSSGVLKISSKILTNNGSCKKFEGYYIQKKNFKNKKRKNHRSEYSMTKNVFDFSSTSNEDIKTTENKSNWKRLTRAKFKPDKTSEDSLEEPEIENLLISPKRKKLKLDNKKPKMGSPRENQCFNESCDLYVANTEAELIVTNISDKHYKNESLLKKSENIKEIQFEKHLKKSSSESQLKTISAVVEERNRCDTSTSTSRTFRASSVDSKTNYIKSLNLKESELLRGTKARNLRREFSEVAESKSTVKDRSLSNHQPKFCTEFNQRIYLESLDDRRNGNKDLLSSIKKAESSKKIEEKQNTVTMEDSSGEISNETYKMENVKEVKDTKRICKNLEIVNSSTQPKVEFDIGYFTTNSSQMNDELFPNEEIEDKPKNAQLKRCNAGKYQFLEKTLYKLNSFKQNTTEEHFEILQRTDSNKSFSKDISLEAVSSVTMEKKDFQTSISCSTLKKNSTSRPHSAETLHSLKKTFKRKGKKRPHCCKRSSRHYVRKNSSNLKRPSKAESKHMNLLNFTDEEQLKIISVNVAKYLKQKLIDENGEFDSEKTCSLENIEKVFSNLKASQEKLKETLTQESNEAREAETRKDETPPLETVEKKEVNEKRKGFLRRPKVIKFSSNIDKEKSVVALPKVGNNFIKLNKQMAGKYKRLTTPTVKKVPSKEKETEKDQKKVVDSKKEKEKERGKEKDKIQIKKKEQLKEKNLEKDKNVIKQNLKEKEPEIGKPKPEKENKMKKEIPKPKVRTLKKEKNKALPQKTNEELTPPSETPASVKNQKATTKGNPKKKSSNKAETPKKPDSREKESTKESESPMVEETPDQNVEEKLEPNSKKEPSTSHSREKMAETKKCYSSGGSPSNAKNQVEDQTETFKSLITDDANAGCEPSSDTKSKIQEDIKNEAQFKKELEYFIKLQMYLNNEFSKNIETTASKTNGNEQTENYSEAKLEENSFVSESLQLDFSDDKVALVESKNFQEYSSSASELAEFPAKINVEKEATEKKTENETKNKSILTVKRIIDPGNSSTPIEGRDESHSDSSYDCKISITLNPNSVTNEEEGKVQASKLYLEENSNISQTASSLDGSTSQPTLLKQQRKKKESEISLEMKQKLLEILEGEIKREFGFTCGGSSDNSSDCLTFKCEESEGNNRSQSTESSSDNIEILAQISNTMKQYLSYLKETKNVRNGSLDTESKGSES